MTKKMVCVFGTGRAREGEPAYILAEGVGRALAQAGFIVANGGYGGTMRASAKGAAEAGGTVVGVTCSAFGGSANKYVTREVRTETLEERLKNLIKAGDAYVVLPGGTGTLLELATVWELENKGFLDRGKPIILVGDFWKPLVDLVATDDPRCSESVVWAEGPEQVVQRIKENLGM
ncbi:MAG: LOG family protein [Sedimentisphaerales bacterium]|nr:LOG family protein [Sedimentisphaerales bacterium]